MYRRVLVALENSPYDRTIVDHVQKLAKCCGSAVVVIHVADGWAARNMRHLDLRDSEEMREDQAYIERVCAEFAEAGFESDAILACGDPGTEIAAAAQREGCDLIAMATHGHKFLADVVRGSVANEVRHRTTVPVLLVRGVKGSPA